jgi:hypothetical protein
MYPSAPGYDDDENDATGGGRQDDMKEQERKRPGPYVANGLKKKSRTNK